MNPSSDYEALSQAQRQEPTHDTIVPLSTESHTIDGDTAGTGDEEWLRLNLLSLGWSACFSISALD